VPAIEIRRVITLKYRQQAATTKPNSSRKLNGRKALSSWRKVNCNCDWVFVLGLALVLVLGWGWGCWLRQLRIENGTDRNGAATLEARLNAQKCGQDGNLQLQPVVACHAALHAQQFGHCVGEVDADTLPQGTDSYSGLWRSLRSLDEHSALFGS